MRKIQFLLMCLLFALATTPVHADHQRTVLQVGEATMFIEEGSDFELNQFLRGYGIQLHHGKILVKGSGNVNMAGSSRQPEWSTVKLSGSSSSIFEVVVSEYLTKVNILKGEVHVNIYPISRVDATLQPCDVLKINYPRIEIETDCSSNSSFEEWAMNTEPSTYSREVIVERRTEYVVVRTYVPAWGGYHNIHYYCDPYGDCDYLLHRNGYFTYAVGVGWVWVPYDYFWQNVYCYDYDHYYVVTHYHQPSWGYYHRFYHGQTPPQPKVIKQTIVKLPIVKQKTAPPMPANAPIQKETKRKYAEPEGGKAPQRESDQIKKNSEERTNSRREPDNEPKQRIEKQTENSRPTVKPIEKPAEKQTPDDRNQRQTPEPKQKQPNKSESVQPHEKQVNTPTPQKEKPVMEHERSQPVEQPPTVKPVPKDEQPKEKPANKKEPEKKKASPKAKEKKDKEKQQN